MALRESFFSVRFEVSPLYIFSEKIVLFSLVDQTRPLLSPQIIDCSPSTFFLFFSFRGVAQSARTTFASPCDLSLSWSDLFRTCTAAPIRAHRRGTNPFLIFLLIPFSAHEFRCCAIWRLFPPIRFRPAPSQVCVL